MATPYYTFDSLTAENSVGYLIKRCGILMTQLAEQRFESEPVSFTQWIVLIQLAQHPHQSPSALSKHLGHDMGALTRIVDDLILKNLVNRERSVHDRRGVQIALTAEGRRLAFAAKRVVLDLINELVAPYSKAEIDTLISLLQRLLVHMQKVEEMAIGQSSVLNGTAMAVVGRAKGVKGGGVRKVTGSRRASRS